MNWETVIGLEVHVQLNTKSKLFSWAPNRFGDEPNENITPVCTGQPGALPVLNKEAVRKAIQFGCAIGAKIPLFSRFDRKSYFYPDSPRNFQITQFDQPIVIGGTVVTEEKTFTVEHAHLEDDAGMLKHFSNFAGVDYNRAGAPLLEIVSDPCMRSPQEAVTYGKAIKAIMEYIGASDCNMEEGSLRIDANISVRLKGEEKLRTKTEIKNMNSFTNMELALNSEIQRQIREYERGAEIFQDTYRWNPDTGDVVRMRRKEGSDDYRYFPEPDLPPIILTKDYIEDIRATLPELPLARKQRYLDELKLTPYSAEILISDKATSDYFEEALAICPDPRNICNWITVEFFGRLKASGKALHKTIPAKSIGELVKLINDKTITGKLAKEIADRMVEAALEGNPKDPQAVIAEDPAAFKPVDSSEVETIVDQVLANNQQSVDDYRAGKTKAFGFLVGQVMKASQGKAPPPLVNQLLKQKLS